MTASLTDRYVAATVRGLDETQRPEVERELLATIEDMVDARLEAGAPTRADAEHAVLVELGDPVRLAAGYSGRPLHLIGPGVYPEWLRLVRVLLVVVVPISVVGNLVARLFVEDLATTDIGSLVGSSIALAVTVALHVVFWTTLVFVILERTGHGPRHVDPRPAARRRAARAGSASARPRHPWSSSSSWPSRSSGSRPARRSRAPARSSRCSTPRCGRAGSRGSSLVLVAQAVLAIVVFRHGRWTTRLAAVSVLLDLAFAVPLLLLLRSGDLFNEAFVDRLVAEGWADAERDLTTSTAVGVLVVLVWSIVEAVRNARAADRRPRGDGSGVERARRPRGTSPCGGRRRRGSWPGT